MKCQKCGYVSFDDLDACKRCGAPLKGQEGGESAEELSLQEDLFTLRLDDEEEEARDQPEGDASPEIDLHGVEPEEPAMEEIGAGEMDDIYLPPAMDGVEPAGVEVPEPSGEDDPGGDEFTLAAESGSPEPIVDDETMLPEDLWVEEGAGFSQRFAAFAVDSLVIVAVLSLFFAAALVILKGDGYSWSTLRSPEGISALIVPFYLLGLFLSLSYFTFFLGWISATPGKILLKLEVCRTDGARMSYTRAFLRWVGYLFSATIAGLGFLWVFFDERKRGWHDYLSGTWVQSLRQED